MKVLLSDLTVDYGKMTDKQYGLLRDAGFSHDDLIGKTQFFYGKMKSEIAYKSANGPALKLQLGFLAAHDVELDREDLTYGVCRHAIRALAKLEGSDQRYLKFIAAYEADNAKRNNRRNRTEYEAVVQSIEQANEESCKTVSVDSDKEEFNDLISTDEWLKRLS